MPVLLFLAAFLPQPSAAAPLGARQDAEAVARTVLARDTRHFADSPAGRSCVSAAMNETTFDPMRRNWDSIAPKSNPHAQGGPKAPFSAVSDLLWWERLARGTSKAPVPLVDSRMARALSSSIARILAAGERPPWFRTIDPSWLPAGVGLCEPGVEQRVLILDSPVVDGDTAFIGTEYRCPLCGQGLIYALRRTAAGWQIVAVHEEWVS
jgi:hypothetical protein